jgi:Arc/MetJ-type ribon-helix-helix transcriptional regulator
MMFFHTSPGGVVRRAKIAISLDGEVLERVDELVEGRVYPNRSRAIQEAVVEKLERLERGRLARECAKLDADFEVAMAEEGLSAESGDWPA